MRVNSEILMISLSYGECVAYRPPTGTGGRRVLLNASDDGVGKGCGA
jgi:hypothetical protein